VRYALLAAVVLALQTWGGFGGVYWDDVRAPANVVLVGIGAGNAADRSLFGTLLFDTAQDEEGFVVMQLPHGYVGGTNIIPHIHWGKTTSAAGDVSFKLDYDCKDIGETFTGALGTTASFTYVIDDGDTDGLHAHAEVTGGFDPGFSGLSGICIFRIWRDVSDDDYAADAELFEFDVHIQMNKPGSQQETVK
jgi:hypothetical protein